MTHNGDFDSFEVFGRKLPCTELRLWLAAVLDAPAPARCDSVAIAGQFKQLLNTPDLIRNP